MYRARKKGGAWGLLDRRGRELAPFRYGGIGVTSDNLEGTSRRLYFEAKKEDEKYSHTFIKVNVPGYGDWEKGFSGSAGHRGYTDPKTGRVLIPERYDTVYSVNYRDRFLVARKGPLYDLYGGAGTLIAPVAYQQLKPLWAMRRALFKAVDGKGRTGLLNERGDTYLPFLYDSVYSVAISGTYNRHLALAARRDGRWGLFLDSLALFPPSYEEIGYFRMPKEDSTGFQVAVKTGGRWGLRNEAGQMVVEPQWPEAPECNSAFPDEIVLTKAGGLYGFYFIRHPERSLPPHYVFDRDRSPEVVIPTKEGYLGYFRITGEDGRSYYLSSSGLLYYKP